jgi:hypothetical protein
MGATHASARVIDFPEIDCSECLFWAGAEYQTRDGAAIKVKARNNVCLKLGYRKARKVKWLQALRG